jgi:hypothetical protein
MSFSRSIGGPPSSARRKPTRRQEAKARATGNAAAGCEDKDVIGSLIKA